MEKKTTNLTIPERRLFSPIVNKLIERENEVGRNFTEEEIADFLKEEGYSGERFREKFIINYNERKE